MPICGSFKSICPCNSYKTKGAAEKQFTLLTSQGFDISPAMLDVAVDREIEGDLCLHDLGQGLPLRAGAFDGAISISAIQWLCNAVRTANCPGNRSIWSPEEQSLYSQVSQLNWHVHGAFCNLVLNTQISAC